MGGHIKFQRCPSVCGLHHAVGTQFLQPVPLLDSLVLFPFRKQRAPLSHPFRIGIGVLYIDAVMLHRIFPVFKAVHFKRYPVYLPVVPVIVVAKVAAHWIVTGVPMTIFATIFGVMFDLELDVTLVMVASLLIGTPVLSLVGAVGAALTLGLRAGGVLTSLLVLPLYIPVLIFGSGAATAAAMSLSPASHFMIVGGLSLFALALAPFAVAAALRIAEQ